MLVWVLFFSVGLDIFVCVCTAYTRACSLGSVGCFCQVAVMNLPAGWPLTGTQGDGWGDNGVDVEREREIGGKGASLEEYSDVIRWIEG